MARPSAFLALLGLLAVAAVVSAGTTAPLTSSPRVAVVGAGIGGATLSHYLRKEIPGVHLDVYESRDYIGGRLKHVVVDGKPFEVGGDAWSVVNYYMQKMKKEVMPGEGPEPTRSVWDSFAHQTTAALDSQSVQDRPRFHSDLSTWNGHRFVDAGRTLKQHWATSGSLAVREANFIRVLSTNYFLRDVLRRQTPFATVEDFLKVSDLDRYLRTPASEFFAKDAPDVVSYFLNPLMRNIYHQEVADTHAFGTLVSLTAAVGARWIQSGNSDMVEALLHNAKANVHLRSTVVSIRDGESSDGGRFVVEVSEGDDASRRTAVYDYVVFAAPMEHTNIDLSRVAGRAEVEAREWVTWSVHLIKARAVDPAYFGLTDKDDIPSTIYTTTNVTNTVPFYSLHEEDDVDGGLKVFKIFAPKTIDRAELNRIFRDVDSVIVEPWPYTFPRLKPNAEHHYQPITIKAGLYNINTMESVASAMECSAISARNVAFLVAQSEQESRGQTLI